jgi:hypothetical protein
MYLLPGEHVRAQMLLRHRGGCRGEPGDAGGLVFGVHGGDGGGDGDLDGVQQLPPASNPSSRCSNSTDRADGEQRNGAATMARFLWAWHPPPSPWKGLDPILPVAAAVAGRPLLIVDVLFGLVGVSATRTTLSLSL